MCRMVFRSQSGETLVKNKGDVCCSGLHTEDFCVHCRQAIAGHEGSEGDDVQGGPMPTANYDYAGWAAARHDGREVVDNSYTNALARSAHYQPRRTSYLTAADFLAGNVEYAPQGNGRREMVHNDMWDILGGGRTPQLTPEQKRDVLPVQNFEYAEWSKERDDERPRY